MRQGESKHEALLKKIQPWIAVLVGVTTLIVGAYNVKKIFFPERTWPGDLILTIQSDQGRPLDGARVELYDAQNILIGTSSSSGGGQFSKHQLDPGAYLIKLEKNGFEGQTMPVRIISRKSTEVNAVLKGIPKAAVAQESTNPIKSAFEETGAAFIRDLGAKVTKSKVTSQS